MSARYSTQGLYQSGYNYPSGLREWPVLTQIQVQQIFSLRHSHADFGVKPKEQYPIFSQEPSGYPRQVYGTIQAVVPYNFFYLPAPSL